MSKTHAKPKPVRGWFHCRGSKEMHFFFSEGWTLCGDVLVPDRPFVPNSGEAGEKPDVAPRCRGCDKKHSELWRKAGGPPK